MQDPNHSYVIAIDVGIKNLGVCVFDFVSSKICHWDNVSLVPHQGRYIPANNVQYVRNLCESLHHYFSNCVQLLVERQMRCNMRIIEAVLQTMFFERCIIISARSVKMHYGLSTKNYRANKRIAVEWAGAFIRSNPGVFMDTVADRFLIGKQDDLADSLLLIMFYLNTYSNQLTDTDQCLNVQTSMTY